MNPQGVSTQNLCFLERYYMTPQQRGSILDDPEIRVDDKGLLYRNDAPIAFIQRLVNEGSPLQDDGLNAIRKIQAVYNCCVPSVKAIASTSALLFPGRRSLTIKCDQDKWKTEELTAAAQRRRLATSRASWDLYLEYLQALSAPPKAVDKHDELYGLNSETRKRAALKTLEGRLKDRVKLLTLCLLDLRNAVHTYQPESRPPIDLPHVLEIAHRQVLAFPLNELLALLSHSSPV